MLCFVNVRPLVCLCLMGYKPCVTLRPTMPHEVLCSLIGNTFTCSDILLCVTSVQRSTSLFSSLFTSCCLVPTFLSLSLFLSITDECFCFLSHYTPFPHLTPLTSHAFPVPCLTPLHHIYLFSHAFSVRPLHGPQGSHLTSLQAHHTSRLLDFALLTPPR